jgi:CPA2 family monovalent cation:H+ antiporter-2
VIGAVIVTLVGNIAAGMLAGKTARMDVGQSLNVGLTIVSRGEFSIIMANVAKSGGLLPVLQPFAALYVLILAVLGPLLTRESDRIHSVIEKLFAKKPAASEIGDEDKHLRDMHEDIDT